MKILVDFPQIRYIGVSYKANPWYKELIFPGPWTSLNRGSTVLLLFSATIQPPLYGQGKNLANFLYSYGVFHGQGEL